MYKYPTSTEPIGERLSEASRNRHLTQLKRRQDKFLRGPVPLDWLSKASAIPGKALIVGLACWFVHGCGQPDKAVCPALLAKFGINRKAGYRGLRALERAGLVTVERRPGRCPRVSIVVKATKGTA